MQLKRRMHSRLAADCKFTREDVAALTESTGLTEAQVLHWASNFRCWYTNPEAREAYINKESDEQVSHLKTCNFKQHQTLRKWDRIGNPRTK